MTYDQLMLKLLAEAFLEIYEEGEYDDDVN